MKYLIQQPKGLWLAGYNWDGEDWATSWTSNKEGAKLLDRNTIVMLLPALPERSKMYRGEWVDNQAIDGVVSLGRRKVRKNGVILFAGSKFRNDKLIPFEGQYVFVEADDYWIEKPHVFKTSACWIEQGNHICDAEMIK